MRKNILLATITLLFLYMILPVISPVVMGAVFAVLLYPLYLKLLRKKLSPYLASALVTVLATLLFFLPSVLLIIFGVKAVGTQFPLLKQMIASPEGPMSWPLVIKISTFMNEKFSVDLSEFFNFSQDEATAMAGKVAASVGDFISHLPAVAVALLIAVISLYFLIIDGHRLVDTLYKLEILPRRQMTQLLIAFSAISKALVVATVLVGLMQAFIFSVACGIAGVKGVALIGFIVFCMSFIPLIGAGPVTFPLAGYFLFFGTLSQGIILLVGAVLASTIDNIIRPLVLKGEADLHPLLAFVGVFGGLQLMGFPGVFIGPIIAGLFATSIKILLIPPEK